MGIVERGLNFFLQMRRPADAPMSAPDEAAPDVPSGRAAPPPERLGKRARIRRFLGKSQRRVMARLKQPGGHARGR